MLITNLYFRNQPQTAGQISCDLSLEIERRVWSAIYFGCATVVDSHNRQISEFSKQLLADLPVVQSFQELCFDICTREAGVNGRACHRLGNLICPPK